MARRRKKANAKLLAGAAVAAILLLVWALPYFGIDFLNFDNLYSQAGLVSEKASECELSVHYIDVGQGDCILISAPGGNALIDCGERGNEETILSYLESQSVTQIDYLVATHPHTDHIGSMAAVLGEIEVQNIIMPKLSEKLIPTTRTYEELLRAIKAGKIKAIPAKAGSKYTLGEAEITVVAPVEQGSDLNNCSVMIKLEYKGSSFLFTGDAEVEEENTVLRNGADVACDVIKLGHHGSSTSSGAEFMEAVSPRFAVITCGKDNSYGHPHRETVQYLNENYIEYYRTDVNGTVVIGTDGNREYGIETEKGAE